MTLNSRGTQFAWARSSPVAMSVSFIVLVISLIYWRILSVNLAPYALPGRPEHIPDWVGLFYGARWWVRAAMAMAGGLLVWLELREHFITSFLKRALGVEYSRFLLLVSLTLVGRSYLFLPGNIAAGDNEVAVTNGWAIRHSIESGIWGPFWSNFVNMGSPWGQFHFTLYYYTTGLVGLLVKDPFLSTKVVLLLAHIAMTYTMFLFVQHLTRSVWAGLFSAIIWSVTFYHYHQFVHLGTTVISLILPLLPLQLYWFETTLGRSFNSRNRAWLALAIGVQIWDHQLYAALSVGFLLLYALARILTSSGLPKLRGKLKETLALAMWTDLGVLIGSYQIWPVLLTDRNLAGIGGLFGPLNFSAPTIGFERVSSFLSSLGFIDGQWWGGYIGPLVLSLGALGALLVIANRHRRAFGLVAWLLAAGFLTFAPHYLPGVFDTIFHSVPFGALVYGIKTPARYLFFFEFALTAMCGVALKQVLIILSAWLPAWRRILGTNGIVAGRLALAAGSLLAAHLMYLGLSVNGLYPAEWAGVSPGRREAFEWISRGGDGTSRIMDSIGGPEGFRIVMLSGQPSFFSHGEEDTASSRLPLALLARFTLDLRTGHIDPLTGKLVYLLDAGYLVGDRLPLQDQTLLFENELSRVWLAGPHSPMVIADRTYATSDGLEGVLSQIEIDTRRNVANNIPVRDSTGVGALANTNPAPPSLSILKYEVQQQAVRLVFKSNTDAYAQLSYSYYPYLTVFLDGKPTRIFPTAFDLIGLEIPAGVHEIEIVPYLSSVRVASLIMSALAIVVCLVGAGWPH